MNDIIIRSELQQAFPTIIEGLARAQNIFDSIKNFEDIERLFLLGAGLSPHTYRNYLGSIKQFYKFTDGLNPLQVRSGDIEAFYDKIVKQVDRNTACLRIRGLRKFFAGIRRVIPIYTSPFEIMESKLIKKLNRVKKGNCTLPALSEGETKNLLAWLKEDRSTTGLENYAIILMLITSGLRAAELIQLKWKDIECFEGTWKARFIGKGGLDAQQELYQPAVEACREYFIKQQGREPGAGDPLFYSYPEGPRKSEPFVYSALWNRLKEVGKAAKKARIIKRDISFSAVLFRRTFATLLYKLGMKLKAIQLKTRHTSIETLAKHYIDDNESASPYFLKIFKEE